MDVIGVIAAIPELLKMVKCTAVAVGQLSSKARIGKVAQGVRSQVELLAEILESIQRREEKSPIRQSQNTRLACVIRDIRTEIVKLQRLVDKIEGSHGGPSFLKRVQLVLTGFEKQFKEHSDRLDSFKTLLQVYLSEATIASNHRAQLHKLLRPLTNSFIPKKLEGTADWIWSHQVFKCWAKQRAQSVVPSSSSSGLSTSETTNSSDLRNRILLIYGVKGCGKSVLAASTSDGLREKGCTTLFFSFWAGHGRERQTEAMLRTILWQLLESLPVKEQNDHIPHLLESQMQLQDSEFLSLQISKLSKEHKLDVFCILDGIDESSDDWNNIKSGPLHCLIEILQSSPQIRLLLIGRHSSLRTALRRWPLHIELTRELLQGDLIKFISSELDACLNINDAAVRNNIRNELESKSTVMFLWIELMVKELRLSFSLSEIKYTLNRLPNGLDREYCRLFSMLMERLGGRSNNPSNGMVRTRRLLSIAIAASRPLTTTELCLIYAFASPLASPASGYLENQISEEGIIDACGDFITTNRNLMFLGHTSIREFLLRPLSQWGSQDKEIAYFRLDSKECHRMIGLACWRYLQQVDWDQAGGLDEVMSQYPLLEYASNYTVSHFLESDLAPQEVWSHGLDFFNSDKFFAWTEFVAFLESGENCYPPPPVTFWDDALQFWGANILGTSSDGFLPLINRMKQESLKRYMTHGPHDSRAAYLALISNQALGAGAGDQQEAARSSLTVMAGKSDNVNIQCLQNAVRKITINHRDLGLRLLAIISPTINSVLRKMEALVDPLDLLIESLEKSLKGASFLSLMLLGLSIQKIKPKQALRVLRMAQSRVSGKHNLQEAWVLGKLGDCLNIPDETRDEESAERHYSRCMEILQERGRSPFIDISWISPGLLRVGLLTDLDREDEAVELAHQVEERLVNISGSTSGFTSDQGILRKWCHRRVANSGLFMRSQIDMNIRLGNFYFDMGLDEDLDRLLRPFVRNATFISHLDHRREFELLELSARAMEFREKFFDAKETWIKAKGFLDPNTDHDKMVLNYVRCRIARIYYLDGRFENAERELSNVDIASFASFYIHDEVKSAVNCLFSIKMMLGKREEAMQVLQQHLPAITTAFASDEMPSNGDVRFVVRLLLSHGMFAESEIYIRQMLSRLHFCREFNDQEEILLYKAWAFSLRLQVDRPKRVDPYDLYVACFQLKQLKRPYDYSTQLHIGFGLTCVAADRPEEAAAAFTNAATRCQIRACGPDCIDVSQGLLFRALAFQQERNDTDAILLLTRMVSILVNQVSMCDEWAIDYQNQILVVVGHMYLAEIFDRCENLLQGDLHRKNALEVLRREFHEPFDLKRSPRTAGLDPWTLRWKKSCESYILGRIDGKIGPEVSCEVFPLDILWLKLDGDYSFDLVSWDDSVLSLQRNRDTSQ